MRRSRKTEAALTQLAEQAIFAPLTDDRDPTYVRRVSR